MTAGSEGNCAPAVPAAPRSLLLGPLYAIRGFVAVRMFGYQVDVADHRLIAPYFPERYGYDNKWRRRHIGPFCFRWGRLR